MADPLFRGDRRSLLKAAALTPVVLAAGCDSDAPLRISDVSSLESVAVSGIVRPRTTLELSRAIQTNRGAVCIGGTRYSMGGQTMSPGALHVDMRASSRLVWLDVASRKVRVQAGMRWRDLQALIDPHGLAVKIMQSYSNFSIGGSVSVNCHGRYVGAGR